jgi:hypothetical protein
LKIKTKQTLLRSFLMVFLKLSELNREGGS